MKTFNYFHLLSDKFYNLLPLQIMDRTTSAITDSCNENDPSVMFYPNFNVSGVSSLVPESQRSYSYNLDALELRQKVLTPKKNRVVEQQSDQSCRACSIL
jgi:hypothetical protein